VGSDTAQVMSIQCGTASMSRRLRAPRMNCGSPGCIDARNIGAEIFNGLIDRSSYDHEGPRWSEMGAFPHSTLVTANNCALSYPLPSHLLSFVGQLPMDRRRARRSGPDLRRERPETVR
jgi:hypothetical protein